MFETSIFCDKCGCGYSFLNVEPKYFMIMTAREKGWSIGKRHLCPNCRERKISKDKEDDSRKYWSEFDDEDAFGEMNAYKNAIEIVEKGGIE